MDHWKTNLPFRSDNYSSRLTSHGRPTEDLDSFYEIDIQGSFDVDKNKTKNSRKLEEYLNKTLPKHQAEKCEKTFETRQLPRNEFEKASSEGKQPTLKPKSPLNSHGEKNEMSFKNEGKENQSPDGEAARKFKERLKKHLIENFISENDAPMKSVFKNIRGEVDKSNNQLHFHHHEHHHHYYFDDESMNGVESRFCEATRIANSHGKSHKEKKAEEKPPNTYYMNGLGKSTQTYMKLGGILFENYTLDAFSDSEKTLKPSIALSSLKFSNSDETIPYKNSAFVANNFYNDTEPERFDTNEMIEAESVKEKLLPAVSLGGHFIKRDLKTPSCDTPDKIETTLTNTQRKVQVNTQTLEASLKGELNKIKKDLQRLEEKYQMKRLKNQIDIQKISIYSNKTFIVGKEKLFLRMKDQENLLEKDEEHQVAVNPHIVKLKNNSKEKKEFFKEHFSPREEYLYTNSVYLISNEV